MKIMNKRFDELFRLEMTYADSHKSFVGRLDINKDFNVSMIEIQLDSDEEWETKIKKLGKELYCRKQINPQPAFTDMVLDQLSETGE